MSRSLILVLAAVVLLPGLALAGDDPAGGTSPVMQALMAAECSASAPVPIAGEIAPPIQLSCTARAICQNGSTRNCSSPVGSCTGVNAACPNQAGYVICNGTRTDCLPCQGESCVVGCSDNTDCTGICNAPAEGSCETGCNPQKPWVKYCRCIY